MEQEIWKDIILPNISYEWLYQASNLWNIKSSKIWIKEKILKQDISRHWYTYVSLYKDKIKKKYTVHKLVINSFKKNIENKKCINHIDWIKANNKLENLEWMTYSENMKHAHDTWLKISTENNYFKKNKPNKWKFWNKSSSSKKVNQFDLQWNLIKKWECAMDIERELHIDNANISACCRNKKYHNSAWWFTWKFA